MSAIITPVSTFGNLCGSRIASVTGITKPMPSNEKIAVLPHHQRFLHPLVRRTHPIMSDQSFGLNSSTCAGPRCAMICVSEP
jgi:hypothetical protein